MLTQSQRNIKRVFDITITLLLLPFLIIPLFLLLIAATLDTGQNGLFVQKRVGQHAKLFRMLKIRTLKGSEHESVNEIRQQETRLGSWMRATKIDELPQLINILFGQMSWVGPRPDIPGYADKLAGDDRIILSIKPGLTGPATIKYSDEEKLLMNQEDPNHYNDTIIWPDKVKINKEYISSWSFKKDVGYIWTSIFGKQ